MKYRLAAAVEADLLRIAVEGAQRFGPQQALAYQSGLQQAFELIAEFPLASRERPELSPPVRMHRYNAHLIAYWIDDDVVEILRVRHGREDWETNA